MRNAFALLFLLSGCSSLSLDLSGEDAGAPSPVTYTGTLTRTFDDDGGCPRPEPPYATMTMSVEGALSDPEAIYVVGPETAACTLPQWSFDAEGCSALVPNGYEQIAGAFNGGGVTPELWLHWRRHDDAACIVIDEWRMSP